MSVIAERGSLELLHDPGDSMTPESYTVRLIEEPNHFGSLEWARDWFELSSYNYQLNGSQVQTVKLWADIYL